MAVNRKSISFILLTFFEHFFKICSFAHIEDVLRKMCLRFLQQIGDEC